VRYQPDERLLRYKRNTVELGGFVLFFIVAGISVDGFSGGFIRGNIDHPIMVFVFLSGFYVYNFYMFYVHLNKGLEKHDFTVNSWRHYIISVAKLAIKIELGKIIPQL